MRHFKTLRRGAAVLIAWWKADLREIMLPLSAASFFNLHFFYSMGLRDQCSIWGCDDLSKGKSIQFYSALLKSSLFWSQLSVHTEALGPDHGVL